MFSGMNYVYEVYKEQSFSKAAENLYISQPALSSMIKKIETKIGMPLFDRSTSPIQLTECGKKYIKTAEKIMDLEMSSPTMWATPGDENRPSVRGRDLSLFILHFSTHH